MSKVKLFMTSMAKINTPVVLVRGRDEITFNYDGKYLRSCGKRVKLCFDSFPKALESFETLCSRGYRVREGS